jgi:hypothetical protein
MEHDGIVRMVVASPGDVQAYRRAVVQAAEKINLGLRREK